MRQIKRWLSRWISEQDDHVVDVVRGASTAGFLKVVSAVATFALSVALGRMLGAEQSGIYFLALTTATIAATIGRFGLDSAVIRYVSARSSENRWGAVKAVHRSSLTIGLLGSITVASVLFLTAPVLATSIFDNSDLTMPIRAMALAVVPLALNMLVSRSLQGLSRIRDSVLVFSIVPATITLIGTLLFARRWGVDGVISAYIAGVTVSAIYGEYAWRRRLKTKPESWTVASVREATTELLRSGPSQPQTAERSPGRAPRDSSSRSRS